MKMSPAQKRMVFAVDELLGESRFADAFRLAKPIAETGEAWAETSVGMLYMLGLGVDRNAEEAEKYLSSAACKDHGGAWYSPGEFYKWAAVRK